MQGNFLCCLNKFTLLPENDGQPYHIDTGGATSYGVTRAVWARWIKRTATDEEMREVTSTLVSPLYEAWYWNTVNGNALPLGIDLMVFDHGVLSGEVNSVIKLQRVIREIEDGWVGPDTLDKVHEINPYVLIGKLAWIQEEYYKSLDTFLKNGKGWLVRLDRRVLAAVGMLETYSKIKTREN